VSADDVLSLARAHRDGGLDPAETLERTLAGLPGRDGTLGALARVHADDARARVAELASLAPEERGPLHGVPCVLKANLALEGWETHCGSRLLEGWSAPYTATVVARLLAAGAVPVASAHMDEFAMGSSGENSAWAPVRNPWDPARSPGGSSSGPAAAVAGGLVPFALGSDTGGSVRQPAAFCGVSGFKPTYGRVSRYGLVAFGSSLDAVSPLARSVRELELVLGVIAGEDPRDATTLPGSFEASDAPALRGLRVGVPAEYLGEGLDPGVRAAVEAALADLEARGAVRVPLSLAHTEIALATYYVIATAEASSNLARFEGVRYGRRVEGDGSLAGMMAATRAAGFGAEVRRRILLGTYVLSAGYRDAWYERAWKVRDSLRAEFAARFEEVDLILGPTAPTPAFRLGERSDPLAMYLSDVLTVPASLAGLPAASVPCGHVTVEGRELPVGLQWIGPAGADARVLAAARAWQEATGHHLARPEVTA